MHTPVSEKILITMYVLPKKVEDLSKVGYEQGINDNLHIFLNVKSLKALTGEIMTTAEEPGRCPLLK